MKLSSRPTIVRALGPAVACLLGVAVAGGQARPGGQPAGTEKPPMTEEVFKNVQVLRGIPVDEFMGTMGFFSAALSLNCTDCHVKAANDDWARYAEDTALKQTARKMVMMVRTIDQATLEGNPEVTCYSCHRSGNRPKVVPSLAEQYGSPPEDLNEIESHG